MRYHNITKDDMLNGDGLRVVLWVAGCEHHCPNCQNPVTWDINGGLEFDEAAKKEIFDEADAKEKIKNLIRCVKLGAISYTTLINCFEGHAREFVLECGWEIGIDLEEEVRRENGDND